MVRLTRLLKHRWLDETDAQRALGGGAVERIEARVKASEQRHSGEIRVCVEAGLPLSYLWRDASARERAVTMFGKLRVWDTEHNNGVLIYLLLAEQAIEVVADRGIAKHVSPGEWQNMVGHMSAAFKAGRYEEGLTEALAEISTVLMQHFAINGSPGGSTNPNELPDNPLLM